jgi:acyl-homoserine lactone acylase PvdQ
MVVSPGYEDEMILVGPTGQSGNPLSVHYADKYDDWVKGLIPEQTPDAKLMKLTLMPG